MDRRHSSREDEQMAFTYMPGSTQPIATPRATFILRHVPADHEALVMAATRKVTA